MIVEAGDVHVSGPRDLSLRFADWAIRNDVGEGVAYEMLDESGRHLNVAFLVECAGPCSHHPFIRPNGRHVACAADAPGPVRYWSHVLVPEPMPPDVLAYATTGGAP